MELRNVKHEFLKREKSEKKLVFNIKTSEVADIFCQFPILETGCFSKSRKSMKRALKKGFNRRSNLDVHLEIFISVFFSHSTSLKIF